MPSYQRLTPDPHRTLRRSSKEELVSINSRSVPCPRSRGRTGQVFSVVCLRRTTGLSGTHFLKEREREQLRSQLPTLTRTSLVRLARFLANRGTNLTSFLLLDSTI